MSRRIESSRESRETQISMVLDLDAAAAPRIDTSIGFFDHLLYAFSFHGGFLLEVTARGDTDVDYHHLVEDTGLVLGSCLRGVVDEHGAVRRFASSLVAMDEALAEVAIDVCGRPTAVVRAAFPQPRVGAGFDMALIREFLVALASRAAISLHAHVRYGENSHHMAEALFKALGRAVAEAYRRSEGGADGMSAKGTLFK